MKRTVRSNNDHFFFGWIFIAIIGILILIGCAGQQQTSQVTLDAPAAIPLPTITETPIPTSTYTPEPTSTPTIIPTPLGGVSPKIAFYGQNSEGKAYLYAGDIFDGNLTPLVEISPVPDDLSLFPVKWSHDGSKLIHVGFNNKQQFGIFVYDFVTEKSDLLYKLSTQDKLEGLVWSPDMKEIAFYYDPENKSGSYILVNIENGSLANIGNLIPKKWGLGIKGLVNVKGEINEYPEMDMYTLWTGVRDENQPQVEVKDFVMIQPDGSETVIASFPGDVKWCGSLELIISPDQIHAIMSCSSYGFMYPISFSNLPYTITKQYLIENSGYALDEWLTINSEGRANIPKEVMSLKMENESWMMDWSPDGQYYIYENGIFMDEQAWHFDIKSIQTDKIVFTYHPQLFGYPWVKSRGGLSGFDVVWPKPLYLSQL